MKITEIDVFDGRGPITVVVDGIVNAERLREFNREYKEKMLNDYDKEPMEFTEHDLEKMADSLRSFGFDLPEDWDNVRLAKMAAVIFEAMGIDCA